MSNSPRIAFFGTPDLAVLVLEGLHSAGFTPHVIVTNQDAPQGRKMILTPPPAKVWAQSHGVFVLQPQSLRTDDTVEKYLTAEKIDLIIVAAYGKIIPPGILSIPKHGTINVHPSLLPRFRGASPIRSAILNDERETGVSIMLLDVELDHGPILAQKEIAIQIDAWPLRGKELDRILGEAGASLLVETIPKWIQGEITPIDQNHNEATFCTKITKEMGELDLTADPYQNLLKIRAFDGWPGTFFFHERDGKRIRIKVAEAHIENGELKITRIIPEGRNEMDYENFISQS